MFAPGPRQFLNALTHPQANFPLLHRRVIMTDICLPVRKTLFGGFSAFDRPSAETHRKINESAEIALPCLSEITVIRYANNMRIPQRLGQSIRQWARRDKRQEAVRKASTPLVTLHARTIRYRASSSNYSTVAASRFVFCFFWRGVWNEITRAVPDARRPNSDSTRTLEDDGTVVSRVKLIEGLTFFHLVTRIQQNRDCAIHRDSIVILIWASSDHMHLERTVLTVYCKPNT